MQTNLENAIEKTKALKQAVPPGDTNTAAQVADLEKDLTTAHDQLTTFRSMGSSVLVNPFDADTNSLSNIIFTPTEFFAPAVIVLLLQHLSITFASLSIVRERRSGIMELFRVAPITAFETLIGKFLSYLLFEIILAGVITALAVWVLKVPMFGHWEDYAVAVVVLLFTSLAVGFLISLISRNRYTGRSIFDAIAPGKHFFQRLFPGLALDVAADQGSGVVPACHVRYPNAAGYHVTWSFRTRMTISGTCADRDCPLPGQLAPPETKDGSSILLKSDQPSDLPDAGAGRSNACFPDPGNFVNAFSIRKGVFLCQSPAPTFLWTMSVGTANEYKCWNRI